MLNYREKPAEGERNGRLQESLKHSEGAGMNAGGLLAQAGWQAELDCSAVQLRKARR